MTASVLALCRCVALALSAVDTDTLEEFKARDYPNRLAPTHLQVGLAQLASQHSQAATLDNKLAVAGGAALATLALSLSALSVLSFSGGKPEALEVLLFSGGAVGLFLAFANSVHGLWPRTYRGAPNLPDIRDVAIRGRVTDEDALWLIAASIEQAGQVNDRMMESRVASVKLTYSLMVFGGLMLLAALLSRLLA